VAAGVEDPKGAPRGKFPTIWQNSLPAEKISLAGRKNFPSAGDGNLVAAAQKVFYADWAGFGRKK